MTRKETIGIMAIIKANYPMYYKDKSKQELQAVVNLWHEMFIDDNADLVVRAVKMFIASDNKGFPPVIGQIKHRLVQLTNPEQMTEQEAWNYVKKAVMRSGWHAEEEFEKLPPIVKKLVGSPTQLKEWALMETDNFDTVVGSNFMRSYKVKAKNEKEYQTLPGDIKDLLSGVSDKLMIGDKEGKE
jgi:hypothetical protein